MLLYCITAKSCILKTLVLKDKGDVVSEVLWNTDKYFILCIPTMQLNSLLKFFSQIRGLSCKHLTVYRLKFKVMGMARLYSVILCRHTAVKSQNSTVPTPALCVSVKGWMEEEKTGCFHSYKYTSGLIQIFKFWWKLFHFWSMKHNITPKIFI